MTLGNRIRSLRESTQLNQSETVNAINERYTSKINGAMWSKWENDRDTPSMDSLRIIAKYFKTTLDYLSGMSEETMTDDIPTEKNALLEYFHKTPELNVLFSLAEDLTEEDIAFLVDMAKKLKRK